MDLMDKLTPHGRNDDDERQPWMCDAMSKRSGKLCRRPASRGSTKCHIHGGKSLKGLASPTLRHGRYSRSLPTRLAARYEQAANDPDLLNMSEDIALLDTRLSERLARLDSGESGVLWKKAQTAYYTMRQAMRAGDTPAAGVAMDELGGLITRGHTDHLAWGEIQDLLDQRRRLVDSERKRRVEAEQNITVEKALLLVGAIGQVIKTHVTDRQLLAAISADLEDLME
jgi:hypothetical protein